jgi:hypothetical protein
MAHAHITAEISARSTGRRPNHLEDSSCLDRPVSAKRTVTSFRSSIARSPSAAPQAGQKRAPAGTAAEQRGHPPSTAMSEAFTGRPAK